MTVLRTPLAAIFALCAALALSGCRSAEDRAEGHYQNALTLIAEGDIDRGMVELRNVFQLNETHIDARLKMAELQMERGNVQGAYNQYLRVAEQDPDDIETRILLSEMAFFGSNWEEVERHGLRLVELAPEDPRVEAITLVRDYRAAAEAQDAAAMRELGRQADEMLADQPDNALLRSILVDHAMREQDFTRALAEIDWLIEDDPTNRRHYQDRLQILAQLGDMDAVEAQLRELVELFPEDDAHKATLIRFYLSQDDLDGAEAFLRELVAAAEPDNPGPRLDLIRFLVELRGADVARAELEAAIAEQPDPMPFRIIDAGLDFTEGRQDEAIAKMESLLAGAEPSEQTRRAKVALARMLLATGNEVGARARVEEVLAEDETDAGALKMQAAWQIQADDTDAAISALRVALDQAPADAEAMTLMANAYVRAGQSELARDFLARAVEASGNAPAETLRLASVLIGEERYLPAEDILLDALRLAPANPDLLTTLGDLYLAMEDFGRAQAVADALRRLGNEAALQAANAIEAERLNRQRGTEEAMAFLETLSNSADATLATRITLIRAQLGTGDTQSALAAARQLQEDYPDDASLDVLLAVAQAANDDLEGAIATYEAILEATPARPDLWIELSRLHQRLGDRETAQATIEEGLDQTPDAANLLWAQASFLEQDGEIDAAIEIYERLYAQDSSSLVVANNLASLLTTYRDDEESLDRAWTIARRLRDASAPPLQDTYGWLLHRRGDSAAALPYLEAAAEGLPNDPMVQYHLGQAYLATEQSAEALEQFRRAIDIAGPADTRPQIEEARSLVQSLQEAEAAEAAEETAEEPTEDTVEETAGED